MTIFDDDGGAAIAVALASVSIALASVSIAFSSLALNGGNNAAQRFNKELGRVLIQCADKDHVGGVSPMEKWEFDQDVLKGRNVVYNPVGNPTYLNGKPVPYDTLISWLREYCPPSKK